MQLSDRYHSKRLQEFGMRAVTTYFAEGKTLCTDTQASDNPDIVNAIRIEKDYLRGDNSMLKLHKYDPRIKYTFAGATHASHCQNCGAEISSDSGCCPYCGSAFSMDYDSKDLGSKYHTDLVMNSNTYKYITLAVAAVIGFIISYIYIKTTGRTFYTWDMVKVGVGTVLLGAAMYYVFYYLDSLFVLLPVRLYKERINREQTEFWESNGNDINKTTFFTNLNYELQKYYFERPENRAMVDYDLVDYTHIKLSDTDTIAIDVLLREVYMDGGKLKSRQTKKHLTLRRARREYSLENGATSLKCKNCGAVVDAFAQQCPHCGTRQNYLQEWYMI